MEIHEDEEGIQADQQSLIFSGKEERWENRAGSQHSFGTNVNIPG